MKKLNVKQTDALKGASDDCGKAVIIGTGIGGFFGGIGALVGAAVAATGPACLGYWDY